MSCSNENCSTNYRTKPYDSPSAIVVSIDGDFVCSPSCKVAYERQRDNFLNNIVNNEDATTAWLIGK